MASCFESAAVGDASSGGGASVCHSRALPAAGPLQRRADSRFAAGHVHSSCQSWNGGLHVLAVWWGHTRVHPAHVWGGAGGEDGCCC